jgi:transcriptional regulator with XRE-family HTH domain
MSEVGVVLRQIRKDARMTQEEVAEALDISANYVSLVERGDRTPSWRFLASFANLLKIPVNSLLTAAGLVDTPAVNEEEITALVAVNPDMAVIFELARKNPRQLPELVKFAKYLMSKGEETE